MKIPRRILRLFYPMLMFVNSRKRNNVISGDGLPHFSFYDLKATLNSGEVIQFADYRNKKALIVNTASDCGYTQQYAALKKLSSLYPKLIILLFPSNDFKEQEKGSDEEIAQFCTMEYGLKLPLFKKCSVVKGEAQHPVYRWLSEGASNGWNDIAPQWNFCKYVVDERGYLTHVMREGVDPLSKQMLDALQLH